MRWVVLIRPENGEPFQHRVEASSSLAAREVTRQEFPAASISWPWRADGPPVPVPTRPAP